VPDGHVDRSVGVKKPRYSADEGPSLTELSGYNAKRHEFDPEYDNDAEQALAEMEFKETDSETDRELKLRVLHIYLSRFVKSEKHILYAVNTKQALIAVKLSSPLISRLASCFLFVYLWCITTVYRINVMLRMFGTW
jgi:hypothetical protein